jgi:hypothetical protein
MIFASEHGQNQDDEFNLVLPGRNYGWPTVQGECNTTAEQNFCAENDVVEPLKAWTPCIAVNGMEFYDHEAIPAWNGKLLMGVLGGLGGAYERLSVLDVAADGSVLGESQFFSSFNERIRDVAINPITGSVYVAFNGPSYPGSGPNVIKEFRNDAFANSVVNPTEVTGLGAFPNPSNDWIQLTIPAGDLASIRVYNSNAMLVAQFEAIPAGTPWKLDVSAWAAGSYVVHCQQGRRIASDAFVVQ